MSAWNKNVTQVVGKNKNLHLKLKFFEFTLAQVLILLGHLNVKSLLNEPHCYIVDLWYHCGHCSCVCLTVLKE